MIWSKCEFQWAGYAPYQDRMEKLIMADVTRYREYMMFLMEKQPTGTSDVYVGVPGNEVMTVFDGFEIVADVPKVIDSLLVADVNAFRDAGFEFKHNKKRSA